MKYKTKQNKARYLTMGLVTVILIGVLGYLLWHNSSPKNDGYCEGPHTSGGVVEEADIKCLGEKNRNF